MSPSFCIKPFKPILSCHSFVNICPSHSLLNLSNPPSLVIRYVWIYVPVILYKTFQAHPHLSFTMCESMSQLFCTKPFKPIPTCHSPCVNICPSHSVLNLSNPSPLVIHHVWIYVPIILYKTFQTHSQLSFTMCEFMSQSFCTKSFKPILSCHSPCVNICPSHSVLNLSNPSPLVIHHVWIYVPIILY